MDPVLKSDPQFPHLNSDLSINGSAARRIIVAGRCIEGDIDRIKIPRGRDLVLLPDTAPDYASELTSLIQKTPLRQGLTPYSPKNFLDTFRRAIHCVNAQEAACREAWLEDVYDLYEWYKEVFHLSSANIAIITFKENPTHFDSSLVRDFHVDMPTPNAVSSALLVKAYPSPGLVYGTIENEPPQLPEMLEYQSKLISRLNSKAPDDGGSEWISLDEERCAVSGQVLNYLDQSTITSVPDHFGLLYNGSYRYGLIHRSPQTHLRRAVVTISGYSYREGVRTNCRSLRHF